MERQRGKHTDASLAVHGSLGFKGLGFGVGGLGVQGVRGLGFRVGLKGLGLDGFPPF